MGAPAIEEIQRVGPSPVTPSRVPGRPPRRRTSRFAAAMFTLVLATGIAVTVIRARSVARVPAGPITMPPLLVLPPLRLDGALVRGASRDWMVNRHGPLGYGVPVPVSLTAYCLRGLTRRDHYVRLGIIASDPKLFPLGRYLEVYVGKKYYGRFLIDDTGGAIKGNKLDIWEPSCHEAAKFGRVPGTAVLVPAPRGAAKDTVTTGRLGGKKDG